MTMAVRLLSIIRFLLLINLVLATLVRSVSVPKREINNESDEDYSSASIGSDEDDYEDKDDYDDKSDPISTTVTKPRQEVLIKANATNIFSEFSDAYKLYADEVVRVLFPIFMKNAYESSTSLDGNCMATLMKTFYAIKDQKSWALRCECRFWFKSA